MLAALAAGCGFAADALRYEAKAVERKTPACSDEHLPCTYARIEWIEVVSGPPTVRARINRAILEALEADPEKDKASGTPTPAPAEMADAFIRNYLDEKRPESEIGWSLDTGAKVLRNRPPVFSLQYSSDSFAGGAHGNANVWYLNLDTANGRRLALADVLVEGAVPRLTAISERYFRKERELSPNADLKAAGFWWPDGRFHLNENFGIQDQSLVFFYNQYEIASYADGPTEIEIPFREIRELLRPEYRN